MAKNLRTACAAGDIKLVRKFLDEGADVNERVPSSRFFPLGAAVHFGHLGIVKLLLKHGARLNARTANGWTPLYIAAQKGHTKIVHYLISQGAIVNARAKAVNAYAAVYGETGSTPLHVAKKLPIVKALLKAGADPNIKSNIDYTPIDEAILRKDYKAACIILIHGGQVGKMLQTGERCSP